MRTAELKTVPADVSSDAGHAAVEAALPANAPLSFLVNNAGVGVPDKIENIDRRDFEHALAVNVRFCVRSTASECDT